MREIVAGLLKVYQTDENGYYVGVNMAEEDRLTPGFWLIPGGCVEEAPPSAPSGMIARWQNGAWAVQAIPGPGIAPELPPAESTAQTFRHRLQAHLDGVAQSYGFLSIFDAASFADEPAAPELQASGQALRKWRSLACAYAWPEIDKIEQGLRPIPSFEDFLAELPALDMPGAEPETPSE